MPRRPSLPAIHRRVVLLCSALMVVSATAIIASPASALAPIPPTQVVPDSVSIADPTVVDLNGKFWAYGTNGPAAGAKIPVYMAEDITGPYSYQGKAIEEIPWAKPDTAVFAPDIRHTGGDRLLLYFAATPLEYTNTRKCIGVAVSTTGPAGPFIAGPRPLRCAPRRGGTIDPSYFQHPVSGQNYVLFKTNYRLDHPSDPLREIWVMPISADGLTATAEPTPLIGRRYNVEHPQLMYIKGTYLLFISRNRYLSYDYETAVLQSSTLSGTYTNERAFITTANTKAAGPGGADLVFVEENNVGWAAFFHGWVKEGSNCFARRPMWVAQVTFGANGITPNLAQPVSGGPTPTC